MLCISTILMISSFKIRGVFKKFVACPWRRRNTRVIQCMRISQSNRRTSTKNFLFISNLLFLHTILDLLAYLQTRKNRNYIISHNCFHKSKWVTKVPPIKVKQGKQGQFKVFQGKLCIESFWVFSVIFKYVGVLQVGYCKQKQ